MSTEQYAAGVTKKEFLDKLGEGEPYTPEEVIQMYRDKYGPLWEDDDPRWVYSRIDEVENSKWRMSRIHKD